MTIRYCGVRYCVSIPGIQDISLCSQGYIIHPDLIGALPTGDPIRQCMALQTVHALRMEWSKVPNLDLAVRQAFIGAATTTTLTATQILDLQIALDAVIAAPGQSSNVVADAQAMRNWLNSVFVGSSFYTVDRVAEYYCSDASGAWAYRSLADCDCAGEPCDYFDIPIDCL